MLTLEIFQDEFFDQETNQFVRSEPIVLRFEHSLVSISKWESKYKKPFLSDEAKTEEETYGYLQAMLLADDVPMKILKRLSNKQLNSINDYINDSMTATWFSEGPKKPGSKAVITSEIIYYWMVSLTIPLECENWHFNRLMTLIRVCNEKNKPPEKMSRSEMLAQRRKLNDARRAKYGTKG